MKKQYQQTLKSALSLVRHSKSIVVHRVQCHSAYCAAQAQRAIVAVQAAKAAVALIALAVSLDCRRC